jgi:hypothetical protein
VNAFDFNKFRSNKPATSYVTAHGKRIAVETLPSKTPAPGRRKPFKVEWVKLPYYWIERLDRSKSANTFKLANHILREAYKREQIGGDIILSTEVTAITVPSDQGDGQIKADRGRAVRQSGFPGHPTAGNAASRISDAAPHW